MREHLRQLSNQKHRHQHDPTLQHEYFETLKQYKQTIRQKKFHHTNKTLQEMENAVDQGQFWDMLNSLETTKPQQLTIQDGDIWKNYFNDLYRSIPPEDLNLNQIEIKTKLDNLESAIKNNQNPLDYPITQKELTDKLKTLNSRKACGTDCIKNEMLKNRNP